MIAAIISCCSMFSIPRDGHSHFRLYFCELLLGNSLLNTYFHDILCIAVHFMSCINLSDVFSRFFFCSDFSNSSMSTDVTSSVTTFLPFPFHSFLQNVPKFKIRICKCMVCLSMQYEIVLMWHRIAHQIIIKMEKVKDLIQDSTNNFGEDARAIETKFVNTKLTDR